MVDLKKNPCRRNIFDVFPIDRSETGLKTIREASQKARDQLKFGKIVARDGTELSLTEADLNEMDKILFDPVARLKAEQFVHQAHLFSQDEELADLMRQLAAESRDPMPGLLAEIQAGSLLALVRQVLPEPTPERLEDDLPQVDVEPLEIQLEAWKDAILRDR
jgi:CelD/BcsL family acetyltransferase involved in cellulose biosynthesis